MLENILTVGEQVLVLFLLMAVGFVCGKLKILTGNAVASITDLLLYIVTPCMILYSYQRAFDPDMLRGFLIAFAAAVGIHLINIVLSLLLIRDRDQARRRVLQFAAIFSNCGYMSIPLQQAVLGSDGVFYGSAYIAIFNLIFWSYGVFLMSGDRKAFSGKRILLNPGILPVLAGILMFLLSIPLPEFLNTTMASIASLNTPLPMFITGYYLSNVRFREYPISGAVCWSMALRLILLPFLALGLMALCGVRGVVLVTSTIAASAPAAAATTMFALKFHQDTDLSAELVSLTTLFSILTMPLAVGVAPFLA